jgi:hypothetical protein
LTVNQGPSSKQVLTADIGLASGDDERNTLLDDRVAPGADAAPMDLAVE